MCWNKNSMKYLLAMGMVFLSFMTRPILRMTTGLVGKIAT